MGSDRAAWEGRVYMMLTSETMILGYMRATIPPCVFKQSESSSGIEDCATANKQEAVARKDLKYCGLHFLNILSFCWKEICYKIPQERSVVFELFDALFTAYSLRLVKWAPPTPILQWFYSDRLPWKPILNRSLNNHLRYSSTFESWH